MASAWTAADVEQAYAERCRTEQRSGVLGFAAVDDVRLIVGQAAYLNTIANSVHQMQVARSAGLGICT